MGKEKVMIMEHNKTVEPDRGQVHTNVTSVVMTAFFAAVIFLGIQSFRIPLPAAVGTPTAEAGIPAAVGTLTTEAGIPAVGMPIAVVQKMCIRDRHGAGEKAGIQDTSV